MNKLLLFFLLPLVLMAQPAQDIYFAFPACDAQLGTDSIKIWAHVPANYPTSGGSVMIGLHGLGDPNNSPDIRTYLTVSSDNYGFLLACAEPYLGQENAALIAKSKAVIKETMDSLTAWYHPDVSQTYLCGYSAGSDVAAHYTLENPVYPVKGLIWFAPGFYGSLLFPNIDTAFAAPIPPICMCRGTSDVVSQSGAAKIESIFSGSEVPFLKVSPQGIAHTMNYAGFTADIATCMNFINANTTAVTELASLKLKGYPNPAVEKLFIETLTPQPLSIELTDATGRVLQKQNFGADESKTVLLTTLSHGVYFLRAVNADGHAGVMRMVKE